MESSLRYTSSAPEVFLDERVLDLPDHLLDLLPVGVYVCDRDGLIVRYNRCAAELWGCSPKVGDPTVRFCGSYRLYGLEGRHIPHAKCPMADVLATGHGLRDQEIGIERPDGTRVVALVNIEAMKDGSGRVVGAVNVFRERPEHPRPWLDGNNHVPGSDQLLQAMPVAVYTTDGAGRITFYNEAAAELWGARPEIGKSEFCGSWKLYWPDGTPLQHAECPMALALRDRRPIRGMEAIAERADGSRVPFIAYPVPLFDASGGLVGAVNTLADITERRHAEEQTHLLLREMSHRVKNLFALSSSVVGLSAASAKTPKELASAVQERLAALARAHELTLPKASEAATRIDQATTLQALVQTIFSPYEDATLKNRARVVVTGPDIPVAGGSVTGFALLLHEFSTNAAKYGALSTPTGYVEIECFEHNGQFVLIWKERGGPPVAHEADREGFGSLLARATVRGQLGGDISRDWKPEGLTIRLCVPKDRLTA